MTPAEAIAAAFPGEDLLHHDVRIALLRILRAGQAVEAYTQFTAHWLENIVCEPPYSIWYGPEYPTELVGALRHLANQIDIGVAALNAAKPHWQQFNSHSEEPSHVVGVRSDRVGDGGSGENPF